MLWYSHFFMNFLQFAVVHTVKGFDIVNEAEVDAILEFAYFFFDTTAAKLSHFSRVRLCVIP